jgi:hypothetical protein
MLMVKKKTEISNLSLFTLLAFGLDPAKVPKFQFQFQLQNLDTYEHHKPETLLPRNLKTNLYRKSET